MNRRRNHPYSYPRYNGVRNRDAAHGVDFIDESLSPVNSDEEGYLKAKSDGSYINKNATKINNKPIPQTSDNYQTKEPYSRDSKYPSSDAQYTKDMKYQGGESHFGKDSKYHGDSGYKKDTTKFLHDNYQKNNQAMFQQSTSTFSSEPKKPAEDKEKGEVSDRLTRLENLLQELIEHSVKKIKAEKTPEILPTSDVDDRGFKLEPRRQNFTTSMWINKIQEVSVMNNWNEKSTIQYMETQMSGIIKAWYNHLPNHDFSWPEWKLLITKTFPDNSDFVTTLKRLVTRLKTADETMMNYYFSKMYLIEACKITGEDAVSCLIDGLNNQEVQAAAKSHNFLTPETLYAEYLQNLPDYVVEYLPQNVAYSEPPPPEPEPETNHWYVNDSVPLEGIDGSAQNELMQPYYQDGDPSVMKYQGNVEPYDEQIGDKKNVHDRLDRNFLNFKRHSTKKQPLALKICSFCHERGHIAKHCKQLKRVQYGQNQ